MTKKFTLTKESITHHGVKLYRIKALRSFGNVSKGDLGGYIEKEENVNHDGDAWVYGDAQVSGNARVFGDARVYGGFKLEFGWCFGRKRKYWNVSEIENGDEILLIKDYKPAVDTEKKEIDGVLYAMKKNDDGSIVLTPSL